jgi:hypothetical protein
MKNQIKKSEIYAMTIRQAQKIESNHQEDDWELWSSQQEETNEPDSQNNNPLAG